MNPEDNIISFEEAKQLAEEQYIREIVMCKFWHTNPTHEEVEEYTNYLREQRRCEREEGKVRDKIRVQAKDVQ